MRVLIAKDKHDTYVIDASDRDAAMLELFGMFEDNEYYFDLNEPDAWDVEKPSREKQWYKDAKKGDAKAAARLLEYRKSHGYEYEDRWWFTVLVTPKKGKK